MLLKKSKIILDTLISQPSASSIHSYLGIKDFLIPLLEEKNDCQWNYDNVSLLLQQLIDEEYITAVICTPKVRHFWRCIFLWQRKGKNIENTRQNSNYLL